MTSYVAGFMFSPNMENVVLIEKNKPEWQNGKYNAIGGKIETGEQPISAMVREFEEETTCSTKESDWKPLCKIGTHEYAVHFFYCISEKWGECISAEEEEVFTLPVLDLHTVRHHLIDNLQWLIPLAIDKNTAFSGIINVDPFNI